MMIDRTTLVVGSLGAGAALVWAGRRLRSAWDVEHFAPAAGLPNDRWTAQALVDLNVLLDRYRSDARTGRVRGIVYMDEVDAILTRAGLRTAP